MSTDLVHFLTVIGDAAVELEGTCEALLGRRVDSDPGCYGSEDWSKTDHREIAELCVQLLASCRNLPVRHYSQLLDGWSQGGLSIGLVERPDGRRPVICGDGYDLTVYPSTQREHLEGKLRSRRRTRIYRESSEFRQYTEHLREAVAATLWPESPFLIVVIHQCLGPTRHNDLVMAGLSASLSPRAHAMRPGSQEGPFLAEFQAERCGRKIYFPDLDPEISRSNST